MGDCRCLYRFSACVSAGADFLTVSFKAQFHTGICGIIELKERDSMFIFMALFGLVIGVVIGAIIGAVIGVVVGFLGRLFYPLIFAMNCIDGITGDFWMSHLWLIIVLAAVGGVIGGIAGIVMGWSSGMSE